jgi:hypothetical protein
MTAMTESGNRCAETGHIIMEKGKDVHGVTAWRNRIFRPFLGPAGDQRMNMEPWLLMRGMEPYSFVRWPRDEFVSARR